MNPFRWTSRLAVSATSIEPAAALLESPSRVVAYLDFQPTAHIRCAQDELAETNHQTRRQLSPPSWAPALEDLWLRADLRTTAKSNT